MRPGARDRVEAGDRTRVFGNVEDDVRVRVRDCETVPGFANETEGSVDADNFAQRFALQPGKDVVEQLVEELVGHARERRLAG